MITAQKQSFQGENIQSKQGQHAIREGKNLNPRRGEMRCSFETGQENNITYLILFSRRAFILI